MTFKFTVKIILFRNLFSLLADNFHLIKLFIYFFNILKYVLFYANYLNLIIIFIVRLKLQLVVKFCTLSLNNFLFNKIFFLVIKQH